MIGIESDKNNTISMVYISSVAKSCFMFSSCFQIELVNSKQLECLLKMFFSIQSERGPEKQEQGVCSSEVPPKSVKTSYQGQLFSDQYCETFVLNLSHFFAYFSPCRAKEDRKKRVWRLFFGSPSSVSQNFISRSTKKYTFHYLPDFFHLFLYFLHVVVCEQNGSDDQRDRHLFILYFLHLEDKRTGKAKVGRLFFRVHLKSVETSTAYQLFQQLSKHGKLFDQEN